MSAQRLYKAEWVHEEGVELAEWEQELLDSGFQELHEPDGWREYAIKRWGTEPPEHEHWPNGHKPFFFPATDRIFRSRSAAQNRVDIINRWGGHAVVMECTPVWETVEAANARRERERLHARIVKKRGELVDLIARSDYLRAVEAVAS